MTRPFVLRRGLGPTIPTVLIGLGGGLAAHFLGVPGGLVMGAAIAVSLASVAGRHVHVADPVRDVFFSMIGVIMGASVTPESLRLIVQFPLTLSLLTLELVAIVLVGGFVLRRLFRLDRATAALGLFPGNVALVAAVSSTGLGDARTILVIQTVRLIGLTVLVPLAAAFATPHEAVLREPPAALPALLLVSVLAVAAGHVCERLRIPVGSLLGAMVVVAVARVSGLFSGSIPQLVELIVLSAVGAIIGSRFAAVQGREMRGAIVAALCASVLIVLVVTPFAASGAALAALPLGQVWLAFAPGALEGMGAIGIGMGFDSAFIAVHHIFRLIVLSLAMPFVVRWLRGQT